MAIVMAGSEMGTFIPADSLSYEYASSGGGRNTTFSRAETFATSPGSYFECIPFTGKTDFWTHVRLGIGSHVTGTIDAVSLVSGADVESIRLRYNRATQVLTLDFHNGSGYTTVGSITIAMMDAGHDLDLYSLCNSGSGVLSLYVAGTRRIHGTGLNLASTASIVKTRHHNQSRVSQLVVSDSSTIGGRLFTVPVTGAGASSDWTGSYVGIDEAIYSDADFINSDTAAQVSTFAATAPTLTGYQVIAVAVTARAKRGSASGPQNIQMALRSSGTTYFGSTQALDLGYSGFIEIWEDDPATSSPWQNAAVASLQPGAKSIA